VIGFLRGDLAARTKEGCLVDVGGVGYRMSCSATTLAGLPPDGAAVYLWTHLHVRDDVLALYGFATEGEQRMFEALLGVSGIGPKVALQICSVFTPDAFRTVLATDDVASIASVPGVGKKTAQRVVLELKERWSVPDLQIVGSGSDALSQARSALENLGYSPAEVRAALAETGSASEDVEAMVRTALAVLARRTG
jgi:holliday junction DNA helicase RuvA